MTAAPRTHDWSIDEREYARQESRRGSRFAYGTVDPARTALVVVDMVGFFVAESSHCQGAIPAINGLATALRDAGGTVAWVLPKVHEPTAWETGFYGPELARLFAASGGTGTPRERLWHGLDSRDGDVWAEKSASSAFFPGLSDLPPQLEARGIDTVVVTGTVTSVCCESTARDAATTGHRVIMIADATAGLDDRAHNATLRTVYRSFGDVRTTAEVLELIAAAR
ncbi:isochorismatase family protein [Phytomonospora endophytica]|uniref:Nicotinamidase-related amidase n=1 Tax=Phytomonospora endophytica TaxID=714109 RepID=A0A841FH38_9ACTN|nr:isochorismatase family protein [Phytomonospora endophytica]MBB6035025.1 nicotinamidase-related amidase [Phytomonospora endophytica]GIG68279.1 hydrolase [Phytomonospora endophytica]